MSGTLVILPHRGIGDLMWHLPILRAIAATTPGGQVQFLTQPGTHARSLLAAEPTVSDVIYTPFPRGTVARWREILALARLFRQRRLNQVWILDKISRPAISARLAGVRERFGFGFGAQRRWLSRDPGLPESLRRGHQLDKLAAFAAAMGLALPDTEPRLALVPAAIADIAAHCDILPRPWIGFGFRASTPERDWPDGHSLAFAQGALDRYGGTLFLIGGPKDAADADQMKTRLNRPGIRAACDLPIDRTAALIGRLDALIGGDSAPLNIAAAVGTPCLGLFGVSPPLTYSRHLHPIIGAGMADVAVAAVIDGLDRILGSIRAAGAATVS